MFRTIAPQEFCASEGEASGKKPVKTYVLLHINVGNAFGTVSALPGTKSGSSGYPCHCI